jgi:hypothetical protein
MYVYDSTVNRLPSSGTIGVNDLVAAAAGCARPTRLHCIDFVLAGECSSFEPWRMDVPCRNADRAQCRYRPVPAGVAAHLPRGGAVAAR